MMRYCIIFISILLTNTVTAQVEPQDTSGKKIITLSEVVLSKKLDFPEFIKRIQDDTSFYKAFRNLRVIEYTSINDIRMLDKRNRLLATLRSKTRQIRRDNCRTMEVVEQEAQGDMFDASGAFNYYTAQMYASLFFTYGSVCNETNIIKGTEFSTKGKSGIDKRKEQLKILFFNPGSKIKGLPFISNKTEIYSDGMANDYDMRIDAELFNNVNCYVFRQKVKPGRENKVVIDEMITWFNEETFEIVGRNYSMSFDAGVYDFNVNMEVVMSQFNGLTIPTLIRYQGNWKVVSKKRERGVFTATLSDFK